jgi:hypothetical protein
MVLLYRTKKRAGRHVATATCSEFRVSVPYYLLCRVEGRVGLSSARSLLK